jgi:hypothetical protein
MIKVCWANFDFIQLKPCGMKGPGSYCRTLHCLSNYLKDRAIAQAVSRWLPTAAARVRAWVRSCGISGGQSGAVGGSLRVLRFPLPIFIPPISPQSPSSIIWGWYNRPDVAAVPSGLSPTPLRKKISETWIRWPTWFHSRDISTVQLCSAE